MKAVFSDYIEDNLDWEAKGLATAGIDFEMHQLKFKSEDEVAEKLAFERKDRAYEKGLLHEWEDFDCIDGLLDAQHKLRLAREDLVSELYENRQLNSTVRELNDEVHWLCEERQRLIEEVKLLKQGSN